MAKLLKHLGLGVKKSSSRSECSSSAQKSNSIHELLPNKSPSRHQSSSNVCLATSCSGAQTSTTSTSSAASMRPEYDTGSLKLNLENEFQCQDAERHQYQSLQKCKVKEDTLSPTKSFSSYASDNTADSPAIPKIVDEYCDPLDLTDPASLLVDDDYSVPYDEVNKVLKDIQTHKGDRHLNGISGDKASANGHHLAKVPLKLTSTSQVTSLHIKQRKPKDRVEEKCTLPVDDKSLQESKDDNKTEQTEELNTNHHMNLSESTSDVSFICQTNVNLGTALLNQSSLPSEGTTDSEGGESHLLVPDQLFFSDSTSGGSVTVVSANNFRDVEPINCGIMLSSFSKDGSSEKIEPHGKEGFENGSGMKCQSQIETASLTISVCKENNQSSQTFIVSDKNQSKLENVSKDAASNQLVADMQTRTGQSCVDKSRPKSDGFLLISPINKDFKKSKKKCLLNESKEDAKSQNSNHGHLQCLRQQHKIHGCPAKQNLPTSEKTYSKMCFTRPLEQQRWFHGLIGRNEAEKLLEGHAEGTFLVRISESNNEDFSLSLKNSVGFLHIKIVRQDCREGTTKFILGQFSQPFDSVPSMVQFYCLNRLPVKGNENLSLTNPLFLESFF